MRYFVSLGVLFPVGCGRSVCAGGVYVPECCLIRVCCRLNCQSSNESKLGVICVDREGVITF